MFITVNPSRQRWRCTLNTFKCFTNISLALLGFFLLLRTFHYLAHLCSQKYFTEHQLKEETSSSVKDGTVSAKTHTPFKSTLILHFELSSSVSSISLYPYFCLPSIFNDENVYSAISYLSYIKKAGQKWCSGIYLYNISLSHSHQTIQSSNFKLLLGTDALKILNYLNWVDALQLLEWTFPVTNIKLD